MGDIRFNDEFLSELRFRNPIESVVSSYVNLKRAGSTMKGLCPFHNEKTPSFTVYPENGSYYCFGCQNGGDVITFIRTIENLDYVEAVKLLAERSGMSMPESGYDDSAEKLRKTVLEINRHTAKFFHACLLDEKLGVRARQYCGERRLSAQTVRHFGLGYAPQDGFALCNHLKKLGYSEADMVIANVAGRGKSGRVYDRFRHRMMFPIIDLRGNVIAFGGRKFPEDDSPAKYINTNDTPVYKKSRVLYALNFAKDSKEKNVILCEGYMDVISLHQAGFTNAIACCGTAFTSEQATLLSRYTDEVILSLDADGAGQKATAAAIEILNRAGMKLRVLQIEGGKDPDEFIKAFGPERFRMLLEGAKNDIEFRLFGAKGKYDIETDAGKLQYLNEAVEILAKLSSDIAVNVYAGRLAQELAVDKQAILNQVSKAKKSKQGRELKKQLRSFTAPQQARDDINPEAQFHRRAAIAEETILSILMRNQDLADNAQSMLPPEQFITPFHQRIYAEMLKTMENGGLFDLTRLSGEFSPAEMGRIVVLQNKSATLQNAKKTLLDCIAVLKEERAKLSEEKPESMSDDDWAAAIQKLGRDKK